jgi:hypothetical protein
MKKITLLPLAAFIAVGACTEMDSPTVVAPDAAHFNKAQNYEVTPTATFEIGTAGAGGYEYVGDNKNIRCDSDGLAWNEQSNRRVPGQDKYCEAVGGGTATYSIVWDADYTIAANEGDFGSNLNLEFGSDGGKIAFNGNTGNVTGSGSTPLGDVFVAGIDGLVGTATVDLTQFTSATFAENENGHVCLQDIDEVEAVVTFTGNDPGAHVLKSFCW